MSSKVRLARRDAVALLVGVTCIGLPHGCGLTSAWRARGWAGDYDTGERLSQDSGQDLLIWYANPQPGRANALGDVLDTPVIKRRIKNYARCKLFRSYEPDRRYMAQFGVERAPALVIVHRNGTYRALARSLTAEAVYGFLTDTTVPGKTPAANRHIPRRPEYDWCGDAAAVKRASEVQGKSVLYVFYKRLSRDWSKLRELLERPEVYGRFADMLHCRIHTRNPTAEELSAEFGVVKLPSLVLTKGDGTFDLLEMPTRYESIVRFADRYRRSNDAAVIPSEASVGSH